MSPIRAAAFVPAAPDRRATVPARVGSRVTSPDETTPALVRERPASDNCSGELISLLRLIWQANRHARGLSRGAGRRVKRLVPAFCLKT